jgi:MFS family permease
MQNIGQSWLVLKLTDDVFKLGLLTAMQFLPIMFFSVFGGTLADRLPKRKILVFTQSALAVLAGALALITATGAVRYWMVLLLALLLVLVNAIDQPTRQSFYVEIVGGEHLPNAIMLNSTVFNLARLVGPAIAAVMIGWVGIASCFLFNSLSFLGVIVALLMIRLEAKEAELNLRALFNGNKPLKRSETEYSTLSALRIFICRCSHCSVSAF